MDPERGLIFSKNFLSANKTVFESFLIMWNWCSIFNDFTLLEDNTVFRRI